MSAAHTPARDPSIRWQQFLSAVSSWVISIVTVAALSAVGWYGHATHWTFGLAGHAGHGSDDGGAGHHPAAVSREPSVPAAADVIRFDSPESLARSGIELVDVEERPMVSELLVNGVVKYNERKVAQLSTRVSGIIWKVEKRLGDPVHKGDVLVIVESSEVGTRKAEFLNAMVAYEAKREQLAILEEVKGAVMGRQLREAKSALREATNHLMNAEQALVNLGFDISIADFEKLDDAARASRIRTLGLSDEALAGTDPQRVTSNLIPIRAPFDGLVIGREAVVGEIVEAGRQIFEVADVSKMWVVLFVSKEDASRVAVGQPIRFHPDGAATECESEISWISTAVDDETRTLEVRAEINGQASQSLRANTYGSGRIELARVGTAVVVPSQSVQWDGSRWVVFVPAGETAFAAQPVSPGLRQGDHVEIKGDFAGGPPKQVVAEGSHLLKSKIMLDKIESGEM
jgi:cobalt-zinc-cadmium efflux system membrane fusion protein